MKKTKIVATIGPASDKEDILTKLIQNGVNVARLNFSHNTHDYHTKLIERIRKIEKKMKRPIAILQDLQGPRIRIGKLKEEIEVKKDARVIFFPESEKRVGTSAGVYIPIQHRDLSNDLKMGHRILIEDGTIQFRVLALKKSVAVCIAESSGIIRSHKGVNFPDSSLTTSVLTRKDIRDIEFGVHRGVDFIALSFVRGPRDIVRLRKYIYAFQKKNGVKQKFLGKPEGRGKWTGVHTRIIAKIERKEAVENFDAILEASDGIMVARGDLGIEFPLERVPLIQKEIIQKCNRHGKPVIVATHMLDSMIKNPIPTRAEISDVANAILDGADAIMLSGETAGGKHPIASVHFMAKVAHEVESAHFDGFRNHELYSEEIHSVTEAVSRSVQNIAKDVRAALIICATTSGFTARNIAKHKPSIPIIPITPFDKTRRQLCLTWGVKSYPSPFISSISKLIHESTKIILKHHLAKKGDKVVLCAGHPFGYMGETNLIRVYTIE